MQLLLVGLAPVAVFAAMVWVDQTYAPAGRGRDYVLREELPPIGDAIGLPRIEGPMDPGRPLVVIDAGHGGRDPGAGAGAAKEKAVTLALAKALRDALLARGGFRVSLTRSDDKYLLLPERYAIARSLKADLFISIHADSTPGQAARGATIYTLSARGTDEMAERLAQRENRGGTVNGVAFLDQDDRVNAILVDLSQRDAQARSEDFARLFMREAAGRLPLHKPEPQAAAFVVLKSPDVASVLIEAGYINEPTDLARLTSAEGQEQFAEVTARTVRTFFARRSAGL